MSQAQSSPSGGTAEVSLDEVVDRLDELEAENQQLRERNEELEDRVDELEKQNKILEARCDGLDKNLDRLEDRLEDGDLADDVEDGADPDIPRETPIENVVALPDDVAERELDANVQRARWFAEQASRLGDKTPKGYRLTAGRIGRQLDVNLDCDAHPETVARIISILDEMGGDQTHKRKKNAEKRIILEEDLAKRLKAHSEMRGQ